MYMYILYNYYHNGIYCTCTYTGNYYRSSRIPVLFISLTRSGAVIQISTLFSSAFGTIQSTILSRYKHNNRVVQTQLYAHNVYRHVRNSLSMFRLLVPFLHISNFILIIICNTIYLKYIMSWITTPTWGLHYHIYTYTYTPTSREGCWLFHSTTRWFQLTIMAASTQVISLLISATDKPPRDTPEASLRPQKRRRNNIFRFFAANRSCYRA